MCCVRRDCLCSSHREEYGFPVSITCHADCCFCSLHQRKHRWPCGCLAVLWLQLVSAARSRLCGGQRTSRRLLYRVLVGYFLNTSYSYLVLSSQGPIGILPRQGGQDALVLIWGFVYCPYVTVMLALPNTCWLIIKPASAGMALASRPKVGTSRA